MRQRGKLQPCRGRPAGAAQDQNPVRRRDAATGCPGSRASSEQRPRVDALDDQEVGLDIATDALLPTGGQAGRGAPDQGTAEGALPGRGVALGGPDVAVGAATFQRGRPGRGAPGSGAVEGGLAERGGGEGALPGLGVLGLGLRIRPGLTWIFGIGGLLAYNWWALVPLRPGLMRSPNELFSNLEVSGQPFATAMQHADLLAGLLLVAAFSLAGSRSIPAAGREWLAMMVFGFAGFLGGAFPEVCADEVSRVCRDLEWTFQLPLNQYLHIGAGILEFGGLTVALLFAARRTRGDRSGVADLYRRLAAGAYVAYPLLGLAYLLNRLGGVMEAVFFVGFTLMVLAQLAERTGFRRPAGPSGLAATDARGSRGTRAARSRATG